MADDRTTVTELITGLGMLGLDALETALAAKPGEMVSVSPEQWSHLEDLYRGGAYAEEFTAAWENGVAFLRAREGLRLRRPIRVEWRGGNRQPGDEPVPADLRIDHVFLVSCKYLSKIVTNSSPSSLFDKLLAGGHGGGSSGDWYEEAAPDAYQSLYREVLDYVAAGHDIAVGAGEAQPAATNAASLFDVTEAASVAPDPGAGSGSLLAGDLPESVRDLDSTQRGRIQQAIKGRWPAALRPAASRFSKAVAEASARRWGEALRAGDPERALWRLLRIGSTPYFVLGAAPEDSLRLRVGTAWDWRQQFRLELFTVSPAAREQPVVDWQADIRNRHSREIITAQGHVEIRWSHGKFAQWPEAKVYLDTPHHQVPGYWPLTP
jgi:hypothetical protein